MVRPVVVITGGASGIGLATAQAYAQKGFRVVIGGRRESALKDALAQMPPQSDVQGRSLDVAQRESVNTFFQWVHDSIGPTDILIQAAGVNIKERSMEMLSPKQWDDLMAINATGAYNCMHAVLPSMKQRKQGLIINISSIAGKRAIALGGIAYSASKFAMSALSLCVSNEVASDGIRITTVYPGEVNTPILEHRPSPVSEEHRAKILQPNDVAAVLLSLAELPSSVHIPELVVKPLQQTWY